MISDWEIKLKDRPAQYFTDIFIFRRGSNNKTILYGIKDDSIVEEKEFDLGESVPPTITIPTDLVPILLVAITKKGIKMPEESFTKGKLEATENHLGDLRKLLKLSK